MPSPSSRQKRMCWRPSAAQRGIWREMEQTPRGSHRKEEMLPGSPTDAAAQTAQTNEYLAQGYYIVQEGDKLLDISRKVYGNDNMVAAICEANGITNIDHIQVGDRLQLPNP